MVMSIFQEMSFLYEFCQSVFYICIKHVPKYWKHILSSIQATLYYNIILLLIFC